MVTDDLQDRLLDAALVHVPFDGMNDNAIRAGARDLGLPVDLARAVFARGGADLAAAYHRRGDLALRTWMASAPKEARFRDRIAAAVRHRLQIADRDIVRAGAAVLALPQNAALAARLAWETADVIWDGLGDRSTDVNWYSKRATLAGVHAATVLFWLGDDSPDAGDSWQFLDRRIDGVMRFEKVKGTLTKVPGLGALASALTGWIKAPQGDDMPSADLPGRVRP